jgi:hypothetical protein
MSVNRAKGTAFETRLVKYLRENGFPYAERRALSGSLDRGDITGIPGVVIECKNEKKYDLARYMDETLKEQANAGAQVAFSCFPRRSHHIGDGYALMTIRQALELIR